MALREEVLWEQRKVRLSLQHALYPPSLSLLTILWEQRKVRLSLIEVVLMLRSAIKAALVPLSVAVMAVLPGRSIVAALVVQILQPHRPVAYKPVHMTLCT